jgi:hypothetical protein
MSWNQVGAVFGQGSRVTATHSTPVEATRAEQEFRVPSRSASQPEGGSPDPPWSGKDAGLTIGRAGSL